MSLYDRYFIEPSDIRPGCVLVRQMRPEGWLLFEEPTSVLSADVPEEILPLLRQIDELTEDGKFVAGLLTYEAGAGMDSAIPALSSEFPHLAWFGVYGKPPLLARELAPIYELIEVRHLRDGMSEEGYGCAFDGIKEALKAGASYQVNLTYQTHFACDADTFSLFRSRCGVDPPPYAAFVHGGSWRVASLSPELFLHREADLVRMRPMKGTAEVGAEDQLRTVKSFAENLMIVDMVRNDLGKVAVAGSVKTPSLMEVEPYGPILQMTSTVESVVKVSNADLLQSVFPPASVTGAPKVSSCGLITGLETEPRGVYCGAIGYFGPARFAHLNVAIRTAVFRDECHSELTYGVGGGIVWDSDRASEYQETRLKLKGLTEPKEQWRIVEAFHRDSSLEKILAHLTRMRNTARQFDIPCDVNGWLEAIKALDLSEESSAKIRLTLDREGRFTTKLMRSMLPSSDLRFTLASEAVDSSDPSLGVKTTARGFYTAQRLASRADDVLFYNERDELTEFSTGSLVVQIDGELVTPPAECGCLPGITTAALLREGKLSEMRLSISDLDKFERIFLANGVVGLSPISLIER